jgi:pimeloyl-ACP methyl ester carboxylesterase
MMNVYDSGGAGPPLVIIPGIQGRWEWMRPGARVLSRHYRVITFSLADEPSSGAVFDETRGFAVYVEQVAAAMAGRGIERAVICGVSYGGLIAAAFAARYPAKVLAVVLLSALAPSWRMNERAMFYLRAPRLLFPLFALSSLRLVREMVSAHGGVVAGAIAALRHLWNVVTNPTSPVRMARRVRLLEQVDLRSELATVRAPALIVTGEEGLDYVVPPSHTREYLRLWPHAEGAVLERTGHLGVITRPDALARLLDAFLGRAAASALGRDSPADSVAEQRRMIG